MARTIRKLTSIDASYLYMETPEVPMHIGSMAIFQLPEPSRGFLRGLKGDDRTPSAPRADADMEAGPHPVGHRSSELDRRRTVRHRPPHIPWRPPGALGSRDTSTYRRLATCEAAQSRPAVVGGLRLRLPAG